MNSRVDNVIYLYILMSIVNNDIAKELKKYIVEEIESKKFIEALMMSFDKDPAKLSQIKEDINRLNGAIASDH